MKRESTDQAPRARFLCAPPCVPLEPRAVGPFTIFAQIAQGRRFDALFATRDGSPCVVRRAHRNPRDVSPRDIQASTVDLESFESGNPEAIAVRDVVVGESLAVVLARAFETRTPLPSALALKILTLVAEELDDLPERRAHADLAPHHILIGYDGAIRVVDPAMGQTVSEYSRAPGREAYRSPEHLAGTRVTQRSDAFVLGILFYELLFARPLFDPSTGHVERDILSTQFVHARLRDIPSQPDAVRTLLLRLLRLSRPTFFFHDAESPTWQSQMGFGDWDCVEARRDLSQFMRATFTERHDKWLEILAASEATQHQGNPTTMATSPRVPISAEHTHPTAQPQWAIPPLSSDDDDDDAPTPGPALQLHHLAHVDDGSSPNEALTHVDVAVLHSVDDAVHLEESSPGRVLPRAVPENLTTQPIIALSALAADLLAPPPGAEFDVDDRLITDRTRAAEHRARPKDQVRKKVDDLAPRRVRNASTIDVPDGRTSMEAAFDTAPPSMLTAPPIPVVGPSKEPRRAAPEAPSHNQGHSQQHLRADRGKTMIVRQRNVPRNKSSNTDPNEAGLRTLEGSSSYGDDVQDPLHPDPASYLDERGSERIAVIPVVEEQHSDRRRRRQIMLWILACVMFLAVLAMTILFAMSQDGTPH